MFDIAGLARLSRALIIVVILCSSFFLVLPEALDQFDKFIWPFFCVTVSSASELVRLALMDCNDLDPPI